MNWCHTCRTYHQPAQHLETYQVYCPANHDLNNPDDGWSGVAHSFEDAAVRFGSQAYSEGAHPETVTVKWGDITKTFTLEPEWVINATEVES